MTFRPDNSRTNRASQAEERARMLVQEVLDREERVRNKLASPEVDPWAMRFIVDDSIQQGPIAAWREAAGRARRIMRRFDIQAGYREKLRDVEKRIDSMLYLAESLEEAWDDAAASSKALSDAESKNVEAFEKERERQNNIAEVKRQRDEKRREFRRKAEHMANDALGKTREAGGEVLRRSIDVGREALEKLPNIFGASGVAGSGFPGFVKKDEEPREVRKATARDLRKEPPLPED
ncbi:hypothetical protein [Corynebacterium sp. H78]|uniref:hypothetical protein n=1 Tax=Corynebacterium sp. H78 TaxID=3133417 RepID=UPI0030A042F8